MKAKVRLQAGQAVHSTHRFSHHILSPIIKPQSLLLSDVFGIWKPLPAKESHLHVSAGQHLFNDSEFVSITLNLRPLVLTGNVLQSFIPAGFYGPNTSMSTNATLVG